MVLTPLSPLPADLALDPGQLLDEKEADVEGLADKVEELARRLAEKEADLEAEQAESAALTHDLKKVGLAGKSEGVVLAPADHKGLPQLGTQIFQLEEEADEKDRELEDLRRELEAVDKELENKSEVHEQVVVALKQVRAFGLVHPFCFVDHSTPSAETRRLQDPHL